MAVAAVAVLIERQPPHLTDPASCPGLLEWTTIAVASSRVPLATFITWLNTAGVFVAIVALTRWIQRASDTPLAAASVSIAAAVTVVTAPALAPSHVLAIGAASAAWIAWDAAVATRRALPRAIAWLAFALTAAIAPPLAIPLACVGVWLTWQTTNPSRRVPRLAAAAVAAVAVISWPLWLSSAIPDLPGRESAPTSCLLPQAFSIRHAAAAVTEAFRGTGPAPFALVLVGAFSLWHVAGRAAAWPFAAFALLPIAVSAGSAADPSRVFAPAIAAFWWIVAVGLRETLASLTARRSWRAGAWAIALILPVLQWSHRSTLPLSAFDQPRGHDTLTRRDAAHLIGALPSQSTIVIDDAISELLLRSSARIARDSGKVVIAIPRDGRQATQAAASGRLFAMPRAQFELQHQGLTRVASAEAGIAGVVAFERAGACADVDLRWREAPDLARSTRLAVVADRADARGPILIYLGSSTALNPHPLDWPEWSLRGYYANSYDRSNERDRGELERHQANDPAPSDHRVFGFPFVTRLELWRVPNGPMILPLGLGSAPQAALTRGTTPGDEGALRLCPSFPAEIGRLESVR